ncbi:MAG TPA: hypothetical protein VIJ51_02405 [Solirubrobacteraceae bacterium]
MAADDEGPGDDTEEDDRLRWLKLPVEWATFSLFDEDPCAVRLFYAKSGLDRGDLAEVFISESPDTATVAVTLIERVLAGVSPDSTHYGGLVNRRSFCVEVALETPLGERTLIDGATGRRAEPLRRDAGFPDQHAASTSPTRPAALAGRHE